MKYVESGTSYSHSVDYTYDTLNRLTQLVESINGLEHTTSYTYDDDNRVTEIVNGNVSVTYTYDEYGRVAQKSIGSITFVYEYSTTEDGSPSNQISRQRMLINGVTQTGSYLYTYDDNGNIKAINDYGTINTYLYDDANQLIRENNPTAGKTWIWTYDNAGNIVQRREYAYTTGALGVVLETVNYTYDDSQWGDLLTSYGGAELEYDGIGNLIEDSQNVYVWEHGRELTSMANSSVTWSFTYDANGMRTSRTNGTTTYQYVYTGTKLTQMTVGSNVLYFTYDAAGNPATVTLNGVTFVYTTNPQGDVTAIYTPSGALVCYYFYDAWGNITYSRNMNSNYAIYDLNPLTYRGYVYDSETGLYYLQSRYYNPEWGRFLNADSFVSTGGILGNNMFAYCGNNPVAFGDPSGHARVGSLNRDVCSTLYDNGLGGGGGGAGGGGGISILYVTFELLDDVAAGVIAVATTMIATIQERTHHVYILRDPDNNLVKYVGRTNDPIRRAAEHKRDPKHLERQKYEMTVIMSGLTLDEAKLYEQSLISAYTVSYLDNARREISRKNMDKFKEYLCAAAELYCVAQEDLWELLGRT